jgi:hypothetical protein
MRKTIKQKKRGGAEGRQSSASEQGRSSRKERWTITQQYLEETDNDKSHNLRIRHSTSSKSIGKVLNLA